MKLSIELDREDDGRWIAEALELPGVMTYGETREEAISNTERLAIEVIADRIRHGELPAAALADRQQRRTTATRRQEPPERGATFPPARNVLS